MKRFISYLAIALSITGCAAIGPSDQFEFDTGIAKATPAKEGKVQMSGSGTWWPNAKGFTNVRSALISTGINELPGVLVFTDKSILFQQWDSKSKSFSIIKKIPFNDIRAVALDEFGASRTIVIHSLEYHYDSFMFTSNQGTFVDGNKTKDGYAFLRNATK